MNRRFTAISATLSVVMTLSTVGAAVLLGGGRSAIAQVMLPQAMLNTLGRQCSRTTEVTYRSDQLMAPDGRQVVHFEGLLRKTVEPDSQLRQIDTENLCYSDGRETAVRSLVITNAEGTRELSDSPYEDGYVIYQPRAFSADSRFLAVDMQAAYIGGNPGSYVLFFDLESNRIVSTSDVCRGLEFQSYIGFASETEAVVLCQDHGAASVGAERFEVVDLADGGVSAIASRPEDLMGYGSITREFEVTNSQQFD